MKIRCLVEIEVPKLAGATNSDVGVKLMQRGSAAMSGRHLSDHDEAGSPQGLGRSPRDLPALAVLLLFLADRLAAPGAARSQEP